MSELRTSAELISEIELSSRIGNVAPWSRKTCGVPSLAFLPRNDRRRFYERQNLDTGLNTFYKINQTIIYPKLLDLSQFSL